MSPRVGRLFCVVVGLLALAVVSIGSAKSSTLQVARLSGNVVPLSYDLRIQPHPEVKGGWRDATIVGSESIVVVRALRSVNAVILNQSNVAIGTASIDGEPVAVITSQVLQQVRLRPTHRLRAGEHVLRLSDR